MSWQKILVVLALIFGGYQTWSQRPAKQPAGILVFKEPEQQNFEGAPVALGNYQLTPHARFNIEARVLARERYRFDRAADLIPVDLALGWGAMSDTAVLEKIDISQSGRFYFWNTQDPPIPLEEISTHSANMHMIPADSRVRNALLNIRLGQVIAIQGKLVDVVAKDGWRINSSLTREDTGAGACEVILVDSVRVVR